MRPRPTATLCFLLTTESGRLHPKVATKTIFACMVEHLVAFLEDMKTMLHEDNAPVFKLVDITQLHKGDWSDSRERDSHH
jgi:hypothetical protein